MRLPGVEIVTEPLGVLIVTVLLVDDEVLLADEELEPGVGSGMGFSLFVCSAVSIEPASECAICQATSALWQPNWGTDAR